MTIKRTDKRFKYMIVFMCLVMLVSSIMPGLMGADRAKAANVITIYFDTGNCPDSAGSNGWCKDLSEVYYNLSNDKDKSDEGATNLTFDSSNKMTLTSFKSQFDEDNGKVFKLEFDYASYKYISFSPKSGERKYSGRTARTSDITLRNNIRLYNTENRWGGYQAVWFGNDIEPFTDYSGRKFSIMNMSSENTTMKYRFTDEVREKKKWLGNGTIQSGFYTANVDKQKYYYNCFKVPSSNIANKPYTTVEIYKNDETTLIKKYYMPDNTILDRCFWYGITEFPDSATGEQRGIDYGDKTKLCYQDSNLGSLSAGNAILYLAKESFAEPGATVTSRAQPSGVLTEPTNKDGGTAKYKTVTNISVSAFTAPTTDDQVVDLSSNIMTLNYQGIKYNFFWARNPSHNMINITSNVATISGKYTVQSINNVLKETVGGVTKTYNYVSVAADLYDYQYDGIDSDFNYKYTKKIRVIFERPNWSGIEDNVWIYQADPYEAFGDFPGHKMKYFDTTVSGVRRFYMDVPISGSDVLAKLVFSVVQNGERKQTEDVTINSKYRACCHSGEWDNGKMKVKYYVPDDSVVADNDSERSQKGNAKRPYVAINEKISQSAYADSSTNYPMYLGQFWLPIKPDDQFVPEGESKGLYSKSEGLYNNKTSKYQRSGHNDDSDRYIYDINKDTGFYGYFGFGDYLKNFDWSANLAYRYEKQPWGAYEPYNAVVQGLVADKLQDGKLMAKDGTNSIPYFDLSWWNNDDFVTSQGNTVKMSDYIKSYQDLSFPFYETQDKDVYFKEETKVGRADNGISKMVSDRSKTYEGTYYVFDSSKNVVRVNNEGTDLTKYYDDKNQLVLDNYGKGDSVDSEPDGKEVGIFPFNGPDDGGHNSQKLHYGFGMKFSIDFYLNEYGTLDGTPNGIPITFTFQGDDDVWVFLDDELLLDMGGAHKNSIGEINFANAANDGDGKIYIGAADTVGKSVAVNEALPALSKNFSQLSNAERIKDIVKTGKHKITMYYMERGMLNSNLYVMFNLPMSLTKWELQRDTDFSGVNSGFLNATKYVANDDVFNYAVENAGTTNVVKSDFYTPTNENVTRSNSESSSTQTTILATTNESSQHKNDFKGSKSSSEPLIDENGNGVTYGLKDMFTSGEVAYDTTAIGDVIKGVVPLQYGQKATFSKQFNYGSTMSVEQLDSLSKPTGNGNFTLTGRSAEKYYNTYMKSTGPDGSNKRSVYAGIYNGKDVESIGLNHVEVMYNDAGLNNYGTNFILNPQVDGQKITYNFYDPKDATNEYVHLRQVVVNEVKTAKLTIQKNIMESDNIAELDAKKFKFTINFVNIYGSDDSGIPFNAGNVDIAYYNKNLTQNTSVNKLTAVSGKPKSGQFELAIGERIEISGVPVGTTYYIEEETGGASDMYEFNKDKSIEVGTQSDPAEVDADKLALVVNKRKTGKITLQKMVYNDAGTEVTGDTTEFDVKVTFASPSGVNIGDYTIKANGTNVVLDDSKSVLVKISSTNSVSLTGIPYGATYTVFEPDENMPAEYVKSSSDNVVYTHSADYAVNGLCTADETEKAVVSNKLNPIVMPETGGTPLIFLFPYGIIAIALSGTALVIYKKKLQGEVPLKKRKGRSE